MKKSILTMATLAALAAMSSTSIVHAQEKPAASSTSSASSNVSIYGRVDAGVEYTNNSDAKNNSVLRVRSGGMNTSRWGLRGSENLGNGLKAFFQLEGGILMDEGKIDDDILFRRHANVGLEGNFGKVTLGRSRTTVYEFIIGDFDPMGFAPNYSWGTGATPSSSSKFGMATGFDNLIKYQNTFGDLKVGFTYGMGEKVGNDGDGRKMSMGAVYGKSNLKVLATFEQINGNTLAATGNRDQTQAYHLGVNYVNGKMRYTAALRDYKLTSAKLNTPDVKATTYWGGINYLIQPHVTLTGAIYYVDVKNVPAAIEPDPIMYVARTKYALSKRTDVYLSAAYTKAKNGRMTGVSRDDAGFANNQTGVILGMQHRF
jgi:predicted porin